MSVNELASSYIKEPPNPLLSEIEGSFYWSTNTNIYSTKADEAPNNSVNVNRILIVEMHSLFQLEITCKDTLNIIMIACSTTLVTFTKNTVALLYQTLFSFMIIRIAEATKVLLLDKLNRRLFNLLKGEKDND